MQLTQLDFVSLPKSGYGWRGMLFVAGTLALLGASATWHVQKKSIAGLEMQLSRAQPRTIVRPALSAAQRHSIEGQINAVRAAVRQLNVPIGALVKALQPPKDIRVALLGLDVVAGKNGPEQHTPTDAAGILKIAAEARTPQEMTTYVAFLADQPLFQSVYLVKHELNATSAERPYRFLLEAQWQE